ncbi:hypothetical protein SAMN04487943_109134 [Gracilibacillus orientalis]|uniref:Uncharacterized protein n=1 Tax=Gracilibacillus orientalis TaxID=334253 RepID=A0A1I4NT24_9BACI|nr:hypothetical protein [Gracilibacillus orientalis]SFM18672.1 hypothetical protein SAMN04487943_109134 [Gracilibacillus orientalis]
MLLADVLKLIGAVLEFILGILGIGGAIVLSLFRIPLLVTLVYHIVTLVLAKNNHATVW